MEDGRGGKRAQGSSAAAGQQTDPKKLKHARAQPDIGRFYVPTPKAISPVLRPKDMTREEFVEAMTRIHVNQKAAPVWHGGLVAVSGSSLAVSACVSPRWRCTEQEQMKVRGLPSAHRCRCTH